MATTKKNLVLDLDNTLICSVSVLLTNPDDNPKALTRHKPSIVFREYPYEYRIYLRPHLRNFLKDMCRYYNIILYTNATRSYTERIINHIGFEFFTEIITRPPETPVPPKTLSRIKSFIPTTENLVIIDDSITAWEFFAQNYVYAIEFYSVMLENMDNDIELKIYRELLMSAYHLLDIRDDSLPDICVDFSGESAGPDSRDASPVPESHELRSPRTPPRTKSRAVTPCAPLRGASRDAYRAAFQNESMVMSPMAL